MRREESRAAFPPTQDTFVSGFWLFPSRQEEERELFPVPAQEQVTGSVLERATFIRRKKDRHREHQVLSKAQQARSDPGAAAASHTEFGHHHGCSRHRPSPLGGSGTRM